jgi:hypothetical protein
VNTYRQKTSDLILNGEYERAWQRYCGFLDLSIGEFMQIQWRLMQEQFATARRSPLWQQMFPDAVRASDERQLLSSASLTSYDDYAPFLNSKSDDILGQPIVEWARTSGRGGEAKWVPYTRDAYLQLGKAALANDVLASATKRGEVNIRPNDVMAYNLPSRPYLSGLSLAAVTEHFDFRCLPALDETEQLSFQERNEAIFQRAMIDGIDILGSMTVVLVKMGEQFEQGVNNRKPFSRRMLDPRLLWRGLRARTRARREGRNYILPRDLWQPKGIICGGSDTALYRERIKAYWGVYPHETYGCTEAGILAVQAWDHEDMVFIPSAAFFEFIPVDAWAAERLQGVAPSETLRLDQLEVGHRYEVVVSNFHGGPFLRYRMNDLIEVTSLRNDTLGINLPQFRFVGRSGDFIDLSGFAGLIDEHQLANAMSSGDVRIVDWVVCKEVVANRPMLHLYTEVAHDEAASSEQVAACVHGQLKRLNADYADVESMLGYVPLTVTMLAPGAFNRYIKQKVEQGADLSHLKPARIQPSVAALEALLICGAQGVRA